MSIRITGENERRVVYQLCVLCIKIMHDRYGFSAVAKATCKWQLYGAALDTGGRLL